MKGKLFGGALSFLIVVSFLLTGCTSPTKSPTQTVTPTHTSGSGTILAQKTIPASGGIITVSKSNDPLNGLQITVPSGSYNTIADFTISSRDYQSPNAEFKAVSPLISIENGNDISAKPITLKIPIKYGEDEFPMVFDVASNGELIPIPAQAIDDSSITVEVYHFSDKLVLTAKGQYIKAQELLDLKRGFTTPNFSPEQDVWSFENDGTYISTKGNCAGMSLTALWWFDELSKGKDDRLASLLPGLDTSIHEDDREAWRLVSTVQQDYESSPSASYGAVERPGLVSTKWQGDEVTYKQFQLAMLITGQPQIVLMYGKDKQSGQTLGAGHAMIAYGFKDGIKVADPNDPGVEHIIPYSDSKLGPYDANPEVGNIGYMYDEFVYASKGSILLWDKIGERWQQFANPDLGNDRFPDYNLTLIDEKAQPIALKFDSVYDNTLNVESRNVAIVISSPVSIGMCAYKNDGWEKTTSDGSPAFDTVITLNLVPGDNIVGLYVTGFIGASTEPLWVDFKWVNFVYESNSELWTGELNGTSSYQASQTGSSTWSLVEISFDFIIDVSTTGNQGTGSITGNANVGRVVLTDYASGHSVYRNATITGGAVSGGEQLDVSIPSTEGPIYLNLKSGQPTIKFGSHSRDVYTYSDNPTLPLQCYGIILTIQNQTASSISGTWRFYEPSQYIEGSSPTYSFNLNKVQ